MSLNVRLGFCAGLENMWIIPCRMCQGEIYVSLGLAVEHHCGWPVHSRRRPAGGGKIRWSRSRCKDPKPEGTGCHLRFSLVRGQPSKTLDSNGSVLICLSVYGVNFKKVMLEMCLVIDIWLKDFLGMRGRTPTWTDFWKSLTSQIGTQLFLEIIVG